MVGISSATWTTAWEMRILVVCEIADGHNCSNSLVRLKLEAVRSYEAVRLALYGQPQEYDHKRKFRDRISCRRSVATKEY